MESEQLEHQEPLISQRLRQHRLIKTTLPMMHCSQGRPQAGLRGLQHRGMVGRGQSSSSSAPPSLLQLLRRAESLVHVGGELLHLVVHQQVLRTKSREEEKTGVHLYAVPTALMLALASRVPPVIGSGSRSESRSGAGGGMVAMSSQR